MWLFLIFCTVAIGAIPLNMKENDKLQAVCGRLSNSQKSADGSFVRAEEAPWAVGISYKQQDVTHWCSGTLISSRHILTAASCLVYKRNIVNAGGAEGKYSVEKEEIVFNDPQSLFLTVGGECTERGSSNCQNIHVLGKRDWITKKFMRHDKSDIAVIELREDVREFTDRVKPACLKDIHAPKPTDGTDFDLYGFGGSEVTAEGAHKLQRIVRKVIECNWGEKKRSTFDEVCTKSDRFPNTAHVGGGLITENNGVKQVVAVFGRLGVEEKDHKGRLYKNFDVSIDIQDHLTWICKKTGVCSGDENIETGMDSDSDVELVEEQKVEVSQCDDLSWFYSTRGNEGICYKPVVYGYDVHADVAAAEKQCGDILHAQAAPVRTWQELQKAEAAMNFYWNDHKRPRMNGLTVLGARRYYNDHANFLWNYDNSPVIMDVELWADHADNDDASAEVKMQKPCLALKWYLPNDATSDVPTELRFIDIPCDTDYTQAVLCFKTPTRKFV